MRLKEQQQRCTGQIKYGIEMDGNENERNEEKKNVWKC